MSKRASGPPRRPRNPIAKSLRTPMNQPRVIPDKRWSERLKQVDTGCPATEDKPAKE
jgi:hypothetical protein